jgi:hypothetical protein
MHAVLVLGTSLVLLLAFATAAVAQTASLVARVSDAGRAVVPAASVVLTHAQSNAQDTGLTGNDGTARFTGLVVGEYRLEVTAGNFRVYTETITLAAGDRTIEAVLEIAPIREEVTVEGVATVRPSAG